MSKKNLFSLLLICLASIYLLWWLFLLLTGIQECPCRDYFTDTYGVLAALGAIIGLTSSKVWGYFKSDVGKSIIFISLGLFAQFLGQLSYTLIFYIYGIENAYPSIGEIFYMISIPLYITGILYIGRASGLVFSLKSPIKKAISLVFPLVVIAISYKIFLADYDFTDMPFINVALDFYYPLGQALFMSLAILTVVMTKGLLGGIMKQRVFLILFALVAQYFADALFIQENLSGTWIPAGNSDLVFFLSYVLMSFSLLQFGDIDNKIRKF